MHEAEVVEGGKEGKSEKMKLSESLMEKRKKKGEKESWPTL